MSQNVLIYKQPRELEVNRKMWMITTGKSYWWRDISALPQSHLPKLLSQTLLQHLGGLSSFRECVGGIGIEMIERKNILWDFPLNFGEIYWHWDAFGGTITSDSVDTPRKHPRTTPRSSWEGRAVIEIAATNFNYDAVLTFMSERKVSSLFHLLWATIFEWRRLLPERRISRAGRGMSFCHLLPSKFLKWPIKLRS